MALWSWVVVWLALAASCSEQAPPRERSEPLAAAAHYMVDGQLTYAHGELAYEHAGLPIWQEKRRGVRPYQIVALGPPVLVTALDAELQVTTWAMGDRAHRYSRHFPLVCQPPLVALAALPDSEYLPALGCTLLDADGYMLWAKRYGALLSPAAGPLDRETAYVAVADVAGLPAPDLLFPYGSSPYLAALSTTTSRTYWSASLKGDGPVADIQLWGLTAERGLLSLQYDYRRYEFISFDRRPAGSGHVDLLDRWPLSGQPLTRIVYPGEFDEPVTVDIEDGVVSVAVFTDARYERWEFDLSRGTLHREAAAPPEVVSREENELPDRGSGPPALVRPPFPQHLLPTAAAAEWRIPALVDKQGRVLVIDSHGAQWVSPADLTGE